VHQQSQVFRTKPSDRNTVLDVLGTKVTMLVSGDVSTDQRVTLRTGSVGTGRRCIVLLGTCRS
jgi:hypothetical protein